MIRIGLMIDTYYQPAWAYEMLNRINKIQDVQLSTVILNGRVKEKPNRLKQVLQHPQHLFFELYRRIESKISKPSPDAFALKDIRFILPQNLTTISVVPNSMGGGIFDVFTKADVDQIKKETLDIIVRLGFRILKGDILSSARYGIWSYHHGDNRVNRGGPAGVWEFLLSWKETGSVLQILNEDLDNGTILYRSWAHTHRDFLNASINKFYWKTAAFLPRQIERLIKIGADRFFTEINDLNQNPHFYSNRLFKKPRNLEFFFAMSRKWINLSYYFFTRLLKKEQWFLLYRFDKKKKLSTSGFQFKHIALPRDRYWADPCVIFDDGKYFIFFEDFDYKINKGDISYINLLEDGTYSEVKTALNKPYHLSYPFVFRHNGTYYMIPETQNNKTIELYKANLFPEKWEFVINLMEDVWACDSTILEYENKIWMFTCMKEFEGDTCHDELFIFHADTLETKKWVPHELNPVVSDVKKARPAGGFLKIDGKLFRVSQNCAEAYGKSISLHEVLKLTETEYIEKDVTEFFPQWDEAITRTHTLSFAEGLTLIDGFRKISRF